MRARVQSAPESVPFQEEPAHRREQRRRPQPLLALLLGKKTVIQAVIVW